MNPANFSLRSVVNQDGAAILDVRQGTLTTLNTTGAYVWEALEQGKSFDFIVANLAQQTGQDVATIEQDVREFMEILKTRQLLTDPEEAASR